MSDKSLTVQEVADFLNISKQMAYNLVKDGRLQAFKIGTATRVLYSDLVAFVKNQKNFYSRGQQPEPESREEFRVEGLRVEKGGFTVGPVSVKFPCGSVLAVVGPSGSGKTLFMRGIAGLEHRATGEVWNGAKRLDQIPTPERELSFVFENYALFPHLNVSQNVGFPLSLKKWAEVEKHLSTRLRFEELNIEQGMGLDSPKSLPEGMKQLVAIARERNHAMQAFLMDEPMTRLDADQHRAMRVFMQRVIRDMGKTTIISTHDPQDALALSDHLLILDSGKVVQFGSTWEVYHHPKTAGIMELLSINGVNTVDVEVDGGVTTPLGLPVDEPDGCYTLAFRVDEVESHEEGIGCSVVTKRFYDGKHSIVGANTKDNVVLELLLPHESSEGDLKVRPQHPRLFPRR